jgi:hypothetical protein
VVLILLGVLLARLARRAREGRWVHAHVRVIAGATAGFDVEVVESPADRSSRTCVVRIAPHVDNGAQVLEEIHQ